MCVHDVLCKREIKDWKIWFREIVCNYVFLKGHATYPSELAVF